MVDAALGLQDLGHFVKIYTSSFDKRRAFDEVKNGQIKVQVYGDTLFPRTVKGKFSIICAMLRQLHLVYCLYHSVEGHAYDVFIVDQLSICVPFLRHYFPNAKILFYGHFPDKLLADHESLLKKVYRAPFDWLEQWSTGLSDVIVVNSKFTRSVYSSAFPSIKVHPDVLYPCVSTKGSDKANEMIGPFAKNSYVLSINRFEPYKNIRLALDSFMKVLETLTPSDISQGKYKLVLAGGYDARLEWNVQYLTLLRSICDKANIKNVTIWPDDGESALFTPEVQRATVVFLPSISEILKKKLIANAAVLAYTPSKEHFGIVPLEAMLVGTPVLATNTGGPLETIIHGETGWNYPPTVDSWAPAIKHALFELDDDQRAFIYQHARQRVLQNFSETQMAREFEKYCHQAMSIRRDPNQGDLSVLEGIFALSIMLFFLLIFVGYRLAFT